MPVDSFVGSNGDALGWISAAIAAICAGSWAAPIKSVADFDVHPLVMQSYKTMVLFSTCWLVLFMGEEARWTPYGLLSGGLWVAGGTGGCYAIPNCGMAISVGTWASIMVVINFIWGILIFEEPVRSLKGVCGSFFFLGLGLVGMSKYSAPGVSSKADADAGTKPKVEQGSTEYESNACAETPDRLKPRKRYQDNAEEEDETAPSTEENGRDYTHTRSQDKPVIICSRRLASTRRQAGILSAVWNGVLNGSALLPLHYAKEQGFGGLSYMISFGTGSLITLCVLWILLFAYNYHYTQQQHKGKAVSIRQSFETMPTFYFKEIGPRGILAGSLSSLETFGSILATTILGQGVGNSLVQSKILISGLWGIFWFKEIKEPDAIRKWFLSATLSVACILWLSYERLAAKQITTQ
jgi:glucose uptake protein GlcU